MPVIHAVTDDATLLRSDFMERARDVMEALGPRGALHLRSRLLTARRLYDMAVEARELEQRFRCVLVVNDRLDVALAAGVSAVQLTTRSPRPAEVRALAPALELGVSVHSAAEAIAASDFGAKWCVAGQVYDSATHPGHAGAGVELVSAVTRVARLPVIAIGGVTPERIPALLAAGAHGVAAIRGIWSAPNAGAAAGRYLSEYVAAERGSKHGLANGQR